MEKIKFKQHLTTKNIFNGIIIAFLLAVIFIPSAKSLFISGCLATGLFNPTVDQKISETTFDLSTVKFSDANGRKVSLANFKGKIVFVNFWATWCPPCLAEMKSIHQLHQQFKNDNELVFLMVNADNDFRKAQSYMSRKKYDLPVYGFASDLPAVIFKGSLPTTVVFDKQGRLSFRTEGAANYSSQRFVDFIKKLKTMN